MVHNVTANFYRTARSIFTPWEMLITEGLTNALVMNGRFVQLKTKLAVYTSGHWKEGSSRLL